MQNWKREIVAALAAYKFVIFFADLSQKMHLDNCIFPWDS